jgi:hypothetical protein
MIHAVFQPCVHHMQNSAPLYALFGRRSVLWRPQLEPASLQVWVKFFPALGSVSRRSIDLTKGADKWLQSYMESFILKFWWFILPL